MTREFKSGEKDEARSSDQRSESNASLPVEVILFDVDGVLVWPMMQSIKRYKELYPDRDIDEDRIVEEFFKAKFPATTIGEADLKDLLEDSRNIWNWQGQVDDLLQLWFEADDNVQQEVVDYIQTIRQAGTKCYLTTTQEKYRAAFLREEMFKGVFDGEFMSCEVGAAKPDKHFFEVVIRTLGLRPEQIMFFEDMQESIEVARSMGIRAYFAQGEDALDIIRNKTEAIIREKEES